MSVETLKALFASAKPKLKSGPIEWEGQKETIYYKRLSYGDTADCAIPFLREDGGGLEKGRVKDYQAAVIAKTLRDENGAEIVTPADVLQWDPVFFKAVNEEVERNNPIAGEAVEAAAKNSQATASTPTS
jgi:hypothetical protein